jgi:hypothetical protein
MWSKHSTAACNLQHAALERMHARHKHLNLTIPDRQEPLLGVAASTTIIAQHYGQYMLQARLAVQPAPVLGKAGSRMPTRDERKGGGPPRSMQAHVRAGQGCMQGWARMHARLGKDACKAGQGCMQGCARMHARRASVTPAWHGDASPTGAGGAPQCGCGCRGQESSSDCVPTSEPCTACASPPPPSHPAGWFQ